MAGFGAGFGQGFGPAFNAQRERSHERETDMFRYRMEDLIKRRDKYDEWKKQDSQYMEQAKQIVELTEQDPQSVGYIYDLLKNGGTDFAGAMKLAYGGKFEVDPDIAQQTSDSGLAPQPAENPAVQAGQQAGAVAPAAAQGGTGLLSKWFPSKFKNQESRINDRAMQTLGMSQAELDQIDKGYQPPVVNKAGISYKANPVRPEAGDLTEAEQVLRFAEDKAAANPDDPKAQEELRQAQILYDATAGGAGKQAELDRIGHGGSPLGTMEVVQTMPDGSQRVVMANQTRDGFELDGQKIQARGRSDDEIAMQKNILESMGEPAMKQHESAKNLASAYSAFGNARKLIEQNPQVLNERLAGLTQWGIDLGKEFEGAGQLIGDYLKDPTTDSKDVGAIQETGKKLQGILNDPQAAPFQKLAAAKGMINVSYAMAAYHLAAAKEQAGAKLSEGERKMFTDLPNSATNLQRWDATIGSLLVPTKQILDKNSTQLAKGNPMYGWFKSHYGVDPLEGTAMTNVEDFLDGAGADLDRVLPKDNFGLQPDGSDINPPSGQPNLPTFNTPEDVKKAVAEGTLKPGDRFKTPDGRTKIVPNPQ